MNKVILLLLIGLCAVYAGGVVDLTSSNFDSETGSGAWLLEFFAPWCGHCKRLAPTWEELGTKSQGFKVGKVDCTVEKDLAQRFSIRGYPTIKFIKDGQLYDYSGSRTTEDFIRFATEGYKSKTGVAVPASGAPKARPQAASNKASDKATNTREERKVVHEHDGPSNVVELTDANFASQTSTGKWFVKFYAPWCGHCKRLAPTWDEYSTQAADGLKVGKVDCTVHGATCKLFGVRGYPTLKLIRDGTVYDYKGQRTIEAFEEFASTGYVDATNNPLPRAGGTAAAANDNANSNVVVLTNSNFDEQIKSGTWLVEFYAPWCGHCKSLAPTWEQLANTASDFNVAKVDCTVHRDLATRFGIRGFPTIKLIKDGNLYDYKGARTVEAFVGFVKSGHKSVTPQEIPK